MVSGIGGTCHQRPNQVNQRLCDARVKTFIGRVSSRVMHTDHTVARVNWLIKKMRETYQAMNAQLDTISATAYAMVSSLETYELFLPQLKRKNMAIKSVREEASLQEI
jgi:hypothetical protein